MKKLDILESILRHTIDDVIIDYSVRFDITGGVYDVKPMLYDLPLNSQRLMLGKNIEEKKQQIEAFKNLIKLILPLGIANQDTFFKEEFELIYKCANQYIDEHQLSKDKLYEYAVPESLEFFILSSAQCPSLYQENFNDLWVSLMEFIENMAEHIKTETLTHIGYYPMFALKIIPLLIPFINNSNELRLVYEGLSGDESESCKNYLLQEMEKYQDGQVLSGIFRALSRQELKEETIQTKLIEIYRSDIELDEYAKINLMEALQHFPNEKSIKIGLEIMNEFDQYSSKEAARILLEIGYPAQPIADIFLPKFYSTDINENELALSVLCRSDKFSSHLPSSKALVEIFVNKIKDRRSINIISWMTTMIVSKGDKDASYHIVEYLSSQNPNVLEGILNMISSLMYDHGFGISDCGNYYRGIYIEPFTTSQAVARYMELLNNDNQKIVQNVLRIIGQIGKKECDQKYLHLLLNGIDFENLKKKDYHAIRAINDMLRTIPYDDKITEKYLQVLESTHHEHRLAAIHGLSFSKNEQIKKSIAYLMDDPSDQVRHTYSIYFK